MKKEKIFKNPDLIPLLINYVKVNKVVFPIERVKYLSNEEVIEILKDCIDNQIIYNPNYDKQLRAEMVKAQDLCYAYNQIRPSNLEERMKLITQIVGKIEKNL